MRKTTSSRSAPRRVALVMGLLLVAGLGCNSILGIKSATEDHPADADAGLDGGTGRSATAAFGTVAGGARRCSSAYCLEVQVAPMSPVGQGQSSGYRLRLGPGAVVGNTRRP
jgi:hypothetical protein